MICDRVAAGGDLAFRRDSAALVTLEGDGTLVRLTGAWEWVPGKVPLRPNLVIAEAVAAARSKACDRICADLHYYDLFQEHTDKADIELIRFPSEVDKIAKAYVEVRVLLAESKLDLSLARDDQTVSKLIDQMKETTSRPLAAGGISIDNKRTKSGHGDLVSALVCAVYALSQTKLVTEPGAIPRRMARNPDVNAWRDYPEED